MGNTEFAQSSISPEGLGTYGVGALKAYIVASHLAKPTLNEGESNHSLET